MASPRALPLLLTAALSARAGEGFRCLTREQRPRPISLHKNCRCETALGAVESEGPFNQSPVVTHSCSSSGEATNPNSTGAAHPAYCCFRDFCSPGRQ
uniref:Uncharacterized protein n=2 Tax=Sus scrofa TaxID=9823 RepID=A0A8D1TBT2_PIG